MMFRNCYRSLICSCSCYIDKETFTNMIYSYSIFNNGKTKYKYVLSNANQSMFPVCYVSVSHKTQ